MTSCTDFQEKIELNHTKVIRVSDVTCEALALSLVNEALQNIKLDDSRSKATGGTHQPVRHISFSVVTA